MKLELFAQPPLLIGAGAPRMYIGVPGISYGTDAESLATKKISILKTVYEISTLFLALEAKNPELIDGMHLVLVVIYAAQLLYGTTMITVNRYRALLDRFFILAEMEKLAAGNFRTAVRSHTDAQELTNLRDELELIHQEKLKLFASLQILGLASGSEALTAAAPC